MKEYRGKLPDLERKKFDSITWNFHKEASGKASAELKEWFQKRMHPNLRAPFHELLFAPELDSDNELKWLLVDGEPAGRLKFLKVLNQLYKPPTQKTTPTLISVHECVIGGRLPYDKPAFLLYSGIVDMDTRKPHGRGTLILNIMEPYRWKWC